MKERKRHANEFAICYLSVIKSGGLFTQGFNGICPHGRQIGSIQEELSVLEETHCIELGLSS